MPQIYFDWYAQGLELALARKHAVAWVDPLRFSTTVIVALSLGFEIIPVDDPLVAAKVARDQMAEMAGDAGVTDFSLSPNSFILRQNLPNKKVVLCSPDGEGIITAMQGARPIYLGAFINARAAAQVLQKQAAKENSDIAVIGAGEAPLARNGAKMHYQTTRYRVFANEDYLAAGAIINYLDGRRSLNARKAEEAFLAARAHLADIIKKTPSAIYLARQDNLPEDVELAARLNMHTVVPRLQQGKILAS